MPARKQKTLEEALEEEATKKHLTGDARRRYIGGTIHKIKEEKAGRKKPGIDKTKTTLSLEVEKNRNDWYYHVYASNPGHRNGAKEKIVGGERPYKTKREASEAGQQRLANVKEREAAARAKAAPKAEEKKPEPKKEERYYLRRTRWPGQMVGVMARKNDNKDNLTTAQVSEEWQYSSPITYKTIKVYSEETNKLIGSSISDGSKWRRTGAGLTQEEKEKRKYREDKEALEKMQPITVGTAGKAKRIKERIRKYEALHGKG